MSFQVGAGGERVAGAGDDRDAKRWVVTEVTPHLTHQLVGFDVDGVLDLWAVEGDVGDLTALLVEHLCGHDGLILSLLTSSAGWCRGWRATRSGGTRRTECCVGPVAVATNPAWRSALHRRHGCRSR